MPYEIQGYIPNTGNYCIKIAGVNGCLCSNWYVFMFIFSVNTLFSIEGVKGGIINNQKNKKPNHINN